MPTGLSFASPSQSGDEFSTEVNSPLGTSWTSQFDDSTMATSGTTTDPAPNTPAPAPVDDITPYQRMISATAGNILTGLLGESKHPGCLIQH